MISHSVAPALNAFLMWQTLAGLDEPADRAPSDAFAQNPSFCRVRHPIPQCALPSRSRKALPRTIAISACPSFVHQKISGDRSFFARCPVGSAGIGYEAEDSDDIEMSVRDQNGKVIRCPYCGSEEDCEHTLAVIDTTWAVCEGCLLYTSDAADE